ncbi:hypothetical protein [Actinophytocola sp.]|uniref:hypothetical protein n=1 Tax=Actinophytocola sp. TaxID=1872138 RepID=UPI00389A3108
MNPGSLPRSGVEAGGTRVVRAIGTGPHDIRRGTRTPTTTPAETPRRVADFFTVRREGGPDIAALGLAFFGPLDLDPASASSGTGLPAERLNLERDRIIRSRPATSPSSWQPWFPTASSSLAA